MYGANNFGVSAEVGRGSLPVPSQPLEGKEALLRCFMYAMMSVGNPSDSDVNLEDEIWQNLSELADFSDGQLEGDWICFNVKTGSIGMAFPYKGEWRIRETSVTDEKIREAQEKRFNNRLNNLKDNDG